MPLPLIKLTGDAYSQGVQHGTQLKERIAANLEIYFDRFERETQLTRPEVIAIATQYAAAIEKQNPDYAAGMRGVASGGGFDYLDIVALNVRYEILYYQFGKIAMQTLQNETQADGCTAYALLPEITENKHLLMGQNWDWIPEVQCAVLHSIEPSGLETLGFTEAGIVGAKLGLNSFGIGLGINGLTTTDDDWSRLRKPVHVRCYEVLRQTNFNDAVSVIVSEKRSCSTNFLIGQAPNLVMDIEAAPEVEGMLTCIDGCVTHANHFLDPKELGLIEPPSERRDFSKHRARRLRELLLAAAPVTIDAIQSALRDTENDPFGICRHRNLAEPPEQHYTTVTAVVMDLETRTMHLTDGPPDTEPFQTFSLTTN
jgi:isopenicillin-N N-acyltransferase like protein